MPERSFTCTRRTCRPRSTQVVAHRIPPQRPPSGRFVNEQSNSGTNLPCPRHINSQSYNFAFCQPHSMTRTAATSISSCAGARPPLELADRCPHSPALRTSRFISQQATQNAAASEAEAQTMPLLA